MNKFLRRKAETARNACLCGEERCERCNAEFHKDYRAEQDKKFHSFSAERRTNEMADVRSGVNALKKHFGPTREGSLVELLVWCLRSESNKPMTRDEADDISESMGGTP